MTQYERIGFTRSARRHKIGRARAVYVIENATAVIRQTRPGQPDVVIHLGDDQTGRALEVGVVELDDGHLVVIHAMDMRNKFRGTYDQERWRGDR